MVNVDRYTNQFIKQCHHIENERILIKHGVYMTSQIGIINCINSHCDARMKLLIDITQSEMHKDSKMISMCDNKIIVTYDPKCVMDELKKIDVIIIPKRLARIWEKHICNHVTNDLMIFMKLSDASNMHEQTIPKVVVISDHIMGSVFFVLTSMGFRIRKLIFDVCDDVVVPKSLIANYEFLWIVSFGFLDEYKLDSPFNCKKKGFLKKIIDDIFGEYTLEICDKITITIKDESNTVDKVTQIKSKCEMESLSKVLEETNISQAVNMINPILFTCNQQAYNFVLKNIKNTITDLDAHICSIVPTTSQRIPTLCRKRDTYKLSYDTSLERLSSSSMCNICLDDIEHKTILKCCMNSFCFTCINKWLHINTICPICKKKVNQSKDQVLIPDVSVQLQDAISEENTLYENLIILLKSLESETVLIYYKYKLLLNILKAHNISFQSLKSYLNATTKAKVVLMNETFVPSGLDLSFHNLIYMDYNTNYSTNYSTNYNKDMDTEMHTKIEKLNNSFKPRRIWDMIVV